MRDEVASVALRVRILGLVLLTQEGRERDRGEKADDQKDNEELDQRWNNDQITVVIPEFIVKKWYQNALHNQTALRLKGALLFREGVVVTLLPDNGGKYLSARLWGD